MRDGEVLVDKADLVEYRGMRPERAVTSTSSAPSSPTSRTR
ncbi:hypothetical protein [Pseudonocardia dioxanivorans]|nr:hypothetical protein [Pseudonocardia dioxanivorans]